jgi:uncharacterized membrane protein (UPF0127 family)
MLTSCLWATVFGTRKCGCLEFTGPGGTPPGVTLKGVRLAGSATERLVGWMFKDGPGTTGLWMEPCASVHTWWMRFEVDLAFLAWRDGAVTVLRVERRVVPWRVVSCRGAGAVLEVVAGALDGVQPGWSVRRVSCSCRCCCGLC